MPDQGQASSEASAAFWQKRSIEMPSVLRLNIDYPRASQDARTAYIDFRITTWPDLHLTAQAQATPPIAWLVAAWGVLLGRLCGQSMLSIAVPIHLPTYSRDAWLPLALDINDTAPVHTLVTTVAKELALATSHAHAIPLDFPATPAQLVAEGLTAAAPTGDSQNAVPHLQLRLGTDLQGPHRLVYASALFEAKSAARIAESFGVTLASMLSAPHQLTGDVEMLSPAQREELLIGLNRTATEVPRELLMHQPFEHQAARTPQASAVFAPDGQLTYAELNMRANQLAHKLFELGVAPGDRVAICLERSLNMIVSVFGVLKAGAAYVPLDPSYPLERLTYMLGDCKPTALIAQATSRAQLPVLRIPAIDLDDLTSLQSQPTQNPDTVALGLHAGLPAYVIYTSGSTGQPKGASVFHRGLVNLLHWYTHDYAFGAQDRALVVSSFSFDLTQKNLYVCLFQGGELHLAEQTFDPAAIVSRVESQGITTLNLTPSAFYAIVDAQTPDAFRSLRRVFLGGEPISVPRLSALGANYPHLSIINSYGPTECTDVVAAYTLPRQGASYLDESPPIGRPICNTQLYVLDARRRPVPFGSTGEIWIAGAGIGGGYLDQPTMTAERFVHDTVTPSATAGALMYMTGDQGRWRADGMLEYLGRNDFQVKIRGFRIELGELETKLAGCQGVRDAIVIAREDNPGDKRLVAYLIAHDGARLDANVLRGQLADVLPDYMLPSAFVFLAAFPLTPSGKADRKALPRPPRTRPELQVPYQTPVTEFELAACSVFAEILEIDRTGREDNFFELGGTSLQAVRALTRLAALTGITLSAPTIFAHATPAALAIAAAETADGAATQAPTARSGRTTPCNEPIAIIGMTGRFPGAGTIEALWDNLLAGRDGITHFALDQLDPSVPESARNHPNYVRSRGVIDRVEWFDNAFFGIPAREAEIMDPQHRLFLELAWECLERAGYAADRAPGTVGVFGGTYGPYYLQRNVLSHTEAIEKIGELQVLLTNDKDYAVLRVAHKLNLKGPAVAVHTSCSTSLVAIAQAIDNLRLGRCDMALAGGVSVTSPPNQGYFHSDGSMLTGDGVTRTFDARASGTIFGDGAAFVLLKPFSAALADGDQIFALIRSVATNNDGGGKASFTAPSVDGQAAVIELAHREAGVDPRSIGYVEAHGTATPLGDPVEVEALTRAFRRSTRDIGFCRIGSLKSNIGHMVTAAGAGGMIKTALALHHAQIPASINYDTPNPAIDFARSPFVVNASLTAWPRGEVPRRAGVSNFGVGGTNAHAVMEEAPLRTPSLPSYGEQLLQLSARSPAALEAMAQALAHHLSATPSLNLADVAHTLQHGRSSFAHRLCVVGQTVDECIQALRQHGSLRRIQRSLGTAVPAWIWLFSGQGAQYARMGCALQARDAVFRTALEEALNAIQPWLNFDLRTCLNHAEADALRPTSVTQPALFCLEIALARTWLARGALPTALVGHSVGEFAAAVIAGVMSLADAARLVARRGALMQALPAGSMLTVRLNASEVAARLPAGLSLAAENSPSACVVAGPTEILQNFRVQLEAQGIAARMLHTSHAFHSSMMQAAVTPFEAEVRSVELHAPKIPIISTLTGTWLRAEEATDPAYWSRHLRETVRFSTAVRSALVRHPDAAFLELGPRDTLATLARQHATAGEPLLAVASLGDQPSLEASRLLLAQGQLWLSGSTLRASNASPAEGRQRVLLPTYPFERKRFWLEAKPASAPRAETILSTTCATETAAQPPASSGASTAATTLDFDESMFHVLEQQMQLMTQQLDALIEIALTPKDPGANRA